MGPRDHTAERQQKILDSYGARKEPLQPGCSGTGADSGVSFSVPDMESAERVPTQEGRTARVQTKSQGPSGLNGADRDTAAAARQNAEELTAADDGMGTDERQTMTIKELIQKIGLVEKKREGKNAEQINCIMVVLGADPKSFRREKR